MTNVRFVRWIEGGALIELASRPDGPYDIAVVRTIGGYQRALWPCVWTEENRS